MYKVEQLVVTNTKANSVDEFNIHILKAIGEDNAHKYINFVEKLNQTSDNHLILDGYAVHKIWYFRDLADAEYFVDQKETVWRKVFTSTKEVVFSYGPLKIEEIA